MLDILLFKFVTGDFTSRLAQLKTDLDDKLKSLKKNTSNNTKHVVVTYQKNLGYINKRNHKKFGK